MKMESIEICLLLLLTIKMYPFSETKLHIYQSNNPLHQTTLIIIIPSRETTNIINPKPSHKAMSNKQLVFIQQNNPHPEIPTSAQMAKALDINKNSRLNPIDFILLIVLDR